MGRNKRTYTSNRQMRFNFEMPAADGQDARDAWFERERQRANDEARMNDFAERAARAAREQAEKEARERAERAAQAARERAERERAERERQRREARQAYARATTNPWQVLGVPMGATKAEVRKAWIRLVKQHHPDHGGDAAAFLAVQAAYEALR